MGNGEKISGSVGKLEQNKHRNSQVNSTYMIIIIILIIIRQNNRQNVYPVTTSAIQVVFLVLE